MKVWLKLLIGSLLGILLGLLLPEDNQTIFSALAWLEQLMLRIGRYALVPTLSFALMIAVYELRQDHHLWPLVSRSISILIIGTLFIIGLGILVTIVFPPPRIPILIEGQKESISLGLSQGIMELFPSNMFSSMAMDGSYLLPLLVFSFFLGAGLSYDRIYSKQIISIIDSLSRIFYYIASFFSEILGLVMIVLGAYWAIRFHEALQAEVFNQILLLLGIYSLLLCFVVLPLFLYLLGPKINPWKQIYGALGPALTGFFSGDINFTLPVLLRHAKENHGVRRRANTISLALFSSFGRAGSGMVAVVSLMVIIKSYSSLGVTPTDILFIALQGTLISMLLSRHSAGGAYTALAVLCSFYGKGYEAGYLILKPIAFYLIAIGTLIDVVFASLAAYAVGRMMRFQEDRDAIRFI